MMDMSVTREEVTLCLLNECNRPKSSAYPCGTFLVCGNTFKYEKYQQPLKREEAQGMIVELVQQVVEALHELHSSMDIAHQDY